MAKSNWGITSGFIGKLGNVVGYNWKGKNIQRALTVASKSSTKEQTLQRARFAIITRAGGDLYEAVHEGYRREANSLKTTQNGLFIKYNIGLVAGDDPELLTLDYEHLQLSSDKLNGVDFGQASVTGNTVSVEIADSNLYGRRVSASDRVYLVVYCPEMRDAKCAVVGERVDNSALTLEFPAKWAGKRIYVYAFVVGAASFNQGLASKTEFLGAFGTEAQEQGNGGQQTGGNAGGASNGGNASGDTTEEETLEAPVISGTTTFAESTEVTITGPDGAEIRYTTNGTAPTDSSTLYSEPFTLTSSAMVKAIAVKGSLTSSVTSKQFTKESGVDPDN